MRHILTDLRGNPIYTSFGSWRGNQDRTPSAAGGRTSPLHNPRSLLFMHVTSSEWNEAICRVKSHPQEVLYIDDNGNTPLHRACQLDPPAEVVTMLQDAVTQTNALGATPLHIAASHRCNASALHELIDLYPGALSQLSRMGRTPIHYACMSYRGLDLVAFQVLLEKTLEESRRKQQEQNDELGSSSSIIGEDLRITDFIDILREAKSGDIEDDDEISVLVGDSDSQQATGISASDSSLMLTRSNDGSLTANRAGNEVPDDDEEHGNPHKNNWNVVTWKDASGNTPLGLLFRRYRERVRSVITVLERMRNTSTTTPITASPTSLQTDLGHLWGKARLIVVRLTEEQQQQEHNRVLSGISPQREDDDSSVGAHLTAAAAWSKERFTGINAAAQTQAFVTPGTADIYKDSRLVDGDPTCSKGHGEEKTAPKVERMFRIVHASVALAGYGCPPEMIRLAISIHPHQVREMDEDGNLPLHIAATASSFCTLASNVAMTDEESSVFSDSMASLFSKGSSNRNKGGGRSSSFDTVIKMLLKQYPQAAQIPHGRSGRLPLVLAARAGHRTWNDGMKTLLRAYPPALFSGSKGMVPIKLYPHVLSLIGGGGPPPPLLRVDPLTASHHSYVSNFSSSLHSSGGYPFKGLLHNLLLSKQRQIRELTVTSSITSAHSNAGNASMAGHFNATWGGRQRNHLQSLSSQGNGSNHSSTHRSRNRNASSSSFLCKKKPATVAQAVDTKKNPKCRPAVDPKLATILFELLRIKPDLLEVGRSYRAELKRAVGVGNQSSVYVTSSFGLSAGGMSLTESQQQHPRHHGRWLRRKTSMSGKLLERMTVYERKGWK